MSSRNATKRWFWFLWYEGITSKKNQSFTFYKSHHFLWSRKDEFNKWLDPVSQCDKSNDPIWIEKDQTDKLKWFNNRIKQYYMKTIPRLIMACFILLLAEMISMQNPVKVKGDGDRWPGPAITQVTVQAVEIKNQENKFSYNGWKWCVHLYQPPVRQQLWFYLFLWQALPRNNWKRIPWPLMEMISM